jgi:hypothetical protein
MNLKSFSGIVLLTLAVAALALGQEMLVIMPRGGGMEWDFFRASYFTFVPVE